MDGLNYVPYLNMFGVKAKEIPCLTGSGEPTTETEGAVGMFYMDTDTGGLYKCTAAAESYTWEGISTGSGSSVSVSAERFEQTTGVVTTTGVKITITEDNGDGTYNLSTTNVYDGADGVDGSNGLSIFPFIPGDADLSGVIPLDTVTIPSGRSLQIGDLLLTQGGELYRVTTVYSLAVSGFKAEYFTTLSGGSGDSSGGTETTTHGIIWDLVNVTSSSAVTSVPDGASLVAVLTAADGYTLGDVTVTMGGEALTGVWNADTATVTIPSVTGDIIISCTGVEQTGPVDTSPVIAQYHAGLNTTGGILNIEENSSAYNSSCVTKLYNIPAECVSGGFKYWFPQTVDNNGDWAVGGNKYQIFDDGEYVEHWTTTFIQTQTTPITGKLNSGKDCDQIRFTLIAQYVDDSYAYYDDGTIIFAGKNTQYYGMANIDGTMAGGSSASASSISYDDDVAQDYGVATASMLGEEPVTDTNTVYGIGSEFAAVITEAKTAWMTEYGGDYRKIPIIVSTDQHGRTNSGIFNLIGKTFNMHDISKIMNLGDTISEWYDDDTSKPLLTNSGLQGWMDSIEAIPFSKRLDVFGNHDTWYGNYDDEGNTIGTRYPSSQAHLYQYFRNIYARRTNNNGWFVVYDDAFNVKYVVVSGFEYQDDSVRFRIGTEQMSWLISELEKNDGYDVIIVSHVPLLQDPEQNIYPDGEVTESLYRVSALDTDAFFAARKDKTAGTITDSDGVSHEYDFTGCVNPVLCSLHGHTHYDAYLYLNNSLLVNSFDWFDDSTFFLVLIDRANSQLNVWKISAPDSVPTYINYQIPFDKPSE